MKIMPTLVFAMLSVAATPGAVQTKYDTGAGETSIAATDPALQLGVVVADRSNGAAAPTPAPAVQAKYDPGASNTEIKIGNIMPYTGPAAAYGLIG